MGKSSDKRSFTSFDSIDDARFVPGTILADRYRIVGLLGKKILSAKLLDEG